MGIMIRYPNTLCFFVDGSWISPKEKAGIGWVLYNGEAKTVLEGKGAIEMRKLVYNSVTFYGDSSELYDTLSRNLSLGCNNILKGSKCPTYMEDIAILARGEEYNFHFQKIKRSCNVISDKLAKEGKNKTQLI
ncbi:hypothetical protein BRARA_A01283 [Brassica rapa]|uniref:RNase H type-1 domain-containing protein n=1 Tax=Brassica campestris TaxID=3711 RepID=A0A398AL46_BRACM|nr:hypothetical protein BRARA_A01283 [Brassica rapa]